MKVEISPELSNYMYDVIQKIIDEAGCRMPCSKQEAKAAEIIKDELTKTCDEVEIEPFTCHPRAFLGWIRLDIILVLLSISIFLLIGFFAGDNFLIKIILSTISFGLSLLAFLIIWNEFFNYREFIDKLFKEKPSQNVVGKIKPKGELKKIIIFSGHHDSALQFNLLRYLKVGYTIIIIWGIVTMYVWLFFSGLYFLLTIFNLSNYEWFYQQTIILVIQGAIPLIGLFFFVSSGEKANKVPGAVDNLSAVSIVLALGKYLKENKDIIPENTEIRLISFGCEEAGLRGAYRYAAAHLDELKKYDAEVFNMDGIQSTKIQFIIEYEPTTRTKHSEEVVKKMLKAAEIVGEKAKPFGSTFLQKLVGQISGGTDATAFSKAGIKAANISAMEFKKFPKFYHQPSDTLDKIERGALEITLRTCIGYLIISKDEK